MKLNLFPLFLLVLVGCASEPAIEDPVFAERESTVRAERTMLEWRERIDELDDVYEDPELSFELNELLADARIYLRDLRYAETPGERMRAEESLKRNFARMDAVTAEADIAE